MKLTLKDKDFLERLKAVRELKGTVHRAETGRDETAGVAPELWGQD